MRLRYPEAKLAKPFLASLALHAGLLLVIYFSTIQHNFDQTRDEQPDLIEVILVSRNPQVLIPLPEPEVSAELIEAAQEKESVPEADNEPAIVELNSEPEGIPELPFKPEFVSLNPALEISLPEADFDYAADTSSGLSRSEVSNAIAVYMESYSEELAVEWAQECARYKNRHGTRYCPQEGGRDYSSSFSFSSNSRIEFLGSITKNTEAVGGMFALNQLRMHQDFLVSTPEIWTPQKAQDQFNPKLLGGSIGLVGFGGEGGLINEILSVMSPDLINFNFQQESAVVTVEENASKEGYFIGTPLFRPGR